MLQPFSIIYLLLAVALAISSAWLASAVSSLAWLLNGIMVASLHKSLTFTELTEGTLQGLEMGSNLEGLEMGSNLEY